MKRPITLLTTAVALLCTAPLLAAAGPPNPAGASPRQGRPLLIAHRGGAADYPENTLLAIRQSLAAGVDGEWLSVQATKDGVPVLYRPTDLKTLTDGSGAIKDQDLKDLAGLNAGYRFACADGTHCYRRLGRAVGIPTLAEALKAIPFGKQVYLDLKQTPPAHVVSAVVRFLDRTRSWNRVKLYSTETEVVRLLAKEPHAQVAESRDDTRQRLAEVALEHLCKSTPTASWVGFELKRPMELTEKFTLGQGVSPVTAQLWTKDSVACFTRANHHLPIVMFGVNSREDVSTAASLGADAVLVSSPKRLLGGVPAIVHKHMAPPPHDAVGAS